MRPNVLEVGDILTYEGRKHRVILLNASRAEISPLAKKEVTIKGRVIHATASSFSISSNYEGEVIRDGKRIVVLPRYRLGIAFPAETQKWIEQKFDKKRYLFLREELLRLKRRFHKEAGANRDAIKVKFARMKKEYDALVSLRKGMS